MSYCTVGDHHFSGQDRAIPHGRWQGHGACQECFEREFTTSLRERGEAEACRKAATAARLKALRCPECRKPWRLCVDPPCHRAKAEGKSLGLRLDGLEAPPAQTAEGALDCQLTLTI